MTKRLCAVRDPSRTVRRSWPAAPHRQAPCWLCSEDSEPWLQGHRVDQRHGSRLSGAQRLSGRACVSRQVRCLALPSLLRPSLTQHLCSPALFPPDWNREHPLGTAPGVGRGPFPSHACCSRVAFQGRPPPRPSVRPPPATHPAGRRASRTRTVLTLPTQRLCAQNAVRTTEMCVGFSLTSSSRRPGHPTGCGPDNRAVTNSLPTASSWGHVPAPPSPSKAQLSLTLRSLGRDRLTDTKLFSGWRMDNVFFQPWARQYLKRSQDCGGRRITSKD